MTESTEWISQDIEFAEARAALHDHPHREAALTGARMALQAQGESHPQFRDVVVRAAADILAGQADY